MTELWVERTGVRRYTGRSTRGAEVLIGSVDDEGVFTPGELLKIALAGCSGLSSDQPLRRRLGDDYRATIRVSGDADREQERYPVLEESLEVDLSGFSAEELTRLLTVVERAVDQVCTVGRTLKSGAEVRFGVVDESLARRVKSEDESLARRAKSEDESLARRAKSEDESLARRVKSEDVGGE